MKRCYACEFLLPLFMFSKNNRKYQNATNKGRNYICRICNYKRWNKDKCAWLFNHNTNKFEKLIFKNKLEIIKKTLK